MIEEQVLTEEKPLAEDADTDTQPEIDPQNPFENDTEFSYYNSDYGEIVPQIRIPGCRIPILPNRKEKSRIRRYQNIVGGFLTGHFLLSNILGVVIIELFYLLTAIVDRGTAGTLPGNYDEMLMDYLYDSSSMIALNILAYGAVNVLVVWLGCRATKIPISNLFQTRGFTPLLAVSYVAIALFIQTATGYMASGLTALMDGVGITLYEADFSTEPELKSVILSFAYSVIVAPVTEELLMRGFVMKNLCRSGQRFGIIISAFLFGIWHENLAQFLLAFAAGCFFGYITVKHDSLIPAIICHMVVNGFAELFSICETYGWDMASTVIDMVYMLVVLVGLVALVRLYFVERFPRSTPAQAERGLRITLTSPLMLLVIICHLGAATMYILQASGVM